MRGVVAPESPSNFCLLFFNLIEQGSSSRTTDSAIASSRQPGEVQRDQRGSAGSSLPPEGSAQQSAGVARAPRLEMHAMIHSGPDDGAEMPLTFVDAVSRFAPLSLPSGRQAFVLQVQDGALLAPFPLGAPFG